MIKKVFKLSFSYSIYRDNAVSAICNINNICYNMLCIIEYFDLNFYYLNFARENYFKLSPTKLQELSLF